MSSATLQTEGVHPSKTVVKIYQIKRRHMPEHHSLNLKSEPKKQIIQRVSFIAGLSTVAVIGCPGVRIILCHKGTVLGTDIKKYSVETPLERGN